MRRASRQARRSPPRRAPPRPLRPPRVAAPPSGPASPRRARRRSRRSHRHRRAPEPPPTSVRPRPGVNDHAPQRTRRATAGPPARRSRRAAERDAHQPAWSHQDQRRQTPFERDLRPRLHAAHRRRPGRHQEHVPARCRIRAERATVTRAAPPHPMRRRSPCAGRPRREPQARGQRTVAAPVARADTDHPPPRDRLASLPPTGRPRDTAPSSRPPGRGRPVRGRSRIAAHIDVARNRASGDRSSMRLSRTSSAASDASPASGVTSSMTLPARSSARSLARRAERRDVADAVVPQRQPLSVRPAPRPPTGRRRWRRGSGLRDSPARRAGADP